MEYKTYQWYRKHIIIKYACEQKLKYFRNKWEYWWNLRVHRKGFLPLFLLFLCSTYSKISEANNVETQWGKNNSEHHPQKLWFNRPEVTLLIICIFSATHPLTPRCFSYTNMFKKQTWMQWMSTLFGNLTQQRLQVHGEEYN